MDRASERGFVCPLDHEPETSGPCDAEPEISERGPAPVVLPWIEVVLLAEVLADVDEFFHSPEHFPRVWAELRSYGAAPGRPDAGYLVDAVGLHADRLRELTTSWEDLAGPSPTTRPW
ncbi:MAG: hypothetical protein ACYDB7_11815 [Mycobacteriales bacterium]